MFITVGLTALFLVAALRTIQTVATDDLPTPQGSLGGLFGPTPTPTPQPRSTTRAVNIPQATECRISGRTVDQLLSIAAAARTPTPTVADEGTQSGLDGAATPTPTAAPALVGALPTLAIPTTAAAGVGEGASAATRPVTAAETVPPMSVGTAVSTASDENPTVGFQTEPDPTRVGPTATPTANLPESNGVAANSARIVEIQRVVRELMACSNAGDPLRVWAFYTTGYIEAYARQQGLLFNGTTIVAQTRTRPARQDPVPAVNYVRNMPNGSVTATVRIPVNSLFASTATEFGSATVTFVQENGRWKIALVVPSDGTGG